MTRVPEKIGRDKYMCFSVFAIVIDPKETNEYIPSMSPLKIGRRSFPVEMALSLLGTLVSFRGCIAWALVNVVLSIR